MQDDATVAEFRYERLIEIGLERDDAQWVSFTDIDWHELERLIARGCDPATALRILA